MSLTIKEIAKLANVSRGTVDRVIHGRESVSPETRKRVEQILKEYNYQSNIHAQSLASLKNQFKIGVITNSIDNEFFDLVLEGLKYQNDFFRNTELIIKELKGYDVENQLKEINNLKNQDLNALIITPIDHIDIANALNELKIPIVTVNNDIDIEKLAFVGCDYHNSGMLAGDLANISLKNGGKVAIVVGSFNVRGHKERIKGFRKSYYKGGEILTFENQDDDEISYKITKEIILKDNVDLIYFGAAGIAGGLKALKELNKNIPVITVDETVAVRNSLKTGDVLATITQQPYKQGSRAIRIVHDYLIYNRKPNEVEELTNNKVILKNSNYVIEKNDNNK